MLNNIINNIILNCFVTIVIVVIAHEWIKGAELHPTNTQLLGRIAAKSANIRANLTHAEHVEIEYARDRVVEVIP